MNSCWIFLLCHCTGYLDNEKNLKQILNPGVFDQDLFYFHSQSIWWQLSCSCLNCVIDNIWWKHNSAQMIVPSLSNLTTKSYVIFSYYYIRQMLWQQNILVAETGATHEKMKRSVYILKRKALLRYTPMTYGDCGPPLIGRFMGPTWGLPGTDRTQVGPMWATWTLLSGYYTPVVQHQTSCSRLRGVGWPWCSSPLRPNKPQWGSCLMTQNFSSTVEIPCLIDGWAPVE